MQELLLFLGLVAMVSASMVTAYAILCWMGTFTKDYGKEKDL